MGNFSELVLSHLPEHSCNSASIEKVFLSPKYIIPIFWLALFKTEHIFSKCDEDGYIAYYYEVNKKQGIINFQTRMSVFSSWYGNEYEQLAIIFLKYLENLNYSYLILDINDILGMSVEDTGSPEALKEMNSYVDFEKDNRNFVYRNDLDYKNAIFLLAVIYEEKDFFSQIPDFFAANLVEEENKKTFKSTKKQPPIYSYKKFIILTLIVIIYLFSK